MALSEETLKKLLKDERERSIGFAGMPNSEELDEKRELALNFYKGNVDDLIEPLKDRSKAVSKDVEWVVDQTIPQVVEIFLEEDVVALRPVNEMDEDSARQETDYLNHVIFNQNNGFDLLHTVCKDALLLGAGYLVWNYDAEEYEEEEFTNMGELDFQSALMAAQDEIVPESVQQNPDGTYNWVQRRLTNPGCLKIKAWQPDDVAWSFDTMTLGEGTYCAFRTRVRRQELYADGYDPELIDSLPAMGEADKELELARDMAGETDARYSYSSIRGMDSVEIYYQYIRVYDEGKMRLYEVITGEDESVILAAKEIKRVPAAMFCPFPNPHRLMGQSLAEKVIEAQAVKTVILRNLLDHMQYTHSQRLIVPKANLGKFTMRDIANNSPGAPIRVEGNASGIQPITGGQLNFDPYQGLEYMSTQIEQGTGVVRGSMGINSDALHETKGGMLAMMSAQQGRVRFIARMFAETGMRPMMLGVHDTLRENATMADTVRLRGKFVPVNPASWHARKHLDIEISNSGGKEHDIAALQEVMQLQQTAWQGQGGKDGPMVTVTNLLESAHKYTQKLGIKNPTRFFADPESYQPQPEQPQQDPKAMEAQAKLQLEQQKFQFEQQKAQQEYGLKVQQLQAEIAHKQQQLESMREIEFTKIRITSQDKQVQLQVEAELKLKLAQIEAEIEAKKLELEGISVAMDDENSKLSILADTETKKHKVNVEASTADINVNMPDVRLGGDPT